MREKLILGTVQLGLRYGINNATGKPSESEAFAILDFAIENGITRLDTAEAYGNALEVIGGHYRATSRPFNIINKFKVDHEPLSGKVERSLQLLGMNHMWCYMYHSFEDFGRGAARKELDSLKKEGIIKKFGVSIYDSQQLSSVIDDADVDVIQLPVSILDLDDRKKELLIKAKKSGKEIHARSVFLQGLILKDPETLSGNLESMKPYMYKLRSLAAGKNISLQALALNYVVHQPTIDFVVVGVEQLSQLRENLALISMTFDHKDVGITVDKAHSHLLNPVNWKP